MPLMSASCSVIVPVYNDPGYLAQALASVRAQDFEDWEAIVVDDGSDDNGAKTLVENLGDQRIRYIRHAANRGLSAARNTGIRDAQSEVIVPLDSDDMLGAGYLGRIVPYLSPGSGYNAAFSDHQGFGDFDGVIHKGMPPHEGVTEISDADLVSLLRFQWIPAGGGSFTRELWEAIGGYCEDDALRVGDEDRDFWVGALEHDLRVIYIAEPLYWYRVGDGSMMSRLPPAAWRTHRVIYERHRPIFDKHGIGRAFLADGYATSAAAWRDRGKRRTAIKLAMRSLALEPWRIDAFGVIGRAVLPTPLHDFLRSMLNRPRGRAA